MGASSMSRRGFLAGAAVVAGGLAAAAAAQGQAIGAVARRAGKRPPDPSTLPALKIRVIRREGWGARPPQAKMQRHKPKRLTLHHTGVFLEDNSLAPARLRRHQNWHMDDPDHNYPDIAYHFMVDMAGNVYEGRDWRYRGDTATEYDPTGHFLVCCEGDFDQQEPTAEQLASVAALFAWASQKWSIKPRRLKGHQDYASTTCPGTALEALVQDRSLHQSARRIAGRKAVDLRFLSKRGSRRTVAAVKSDGPGLETG